MNEGDSETIFAYYCLHKFHWSPSKYLLLETNEKAAVNAFILEKMAEDKKHKAELERKSK